MSLNHVGYYKLSAMYLLSTIDLIVCSQGEEFGRPGGHPGERVGGREQHALPRQERHAQSRGGRQDQEGAQVWVLNSYIMANNDPSWT